MQLIREKKYSIITFILTIISFLVSDLGLRIITYNDYKFYNCFAFSPTAFSLSWIILLLGIMSFLKKKKQKIIYAILLLLSNLITYSQYLYFKNIGRFYNIKDIILAKEGAEYFNYALEKTTPEIILIIMLSLILGIIVIIAIGKKKITPKDKLDKIFLIGMTILLFFGLRISAYLNLGKETEGYGASLNMKVAYEEFIDPTKSLQITGIYENTFRSIYINIKNNLTDKTSEQKKEIENYLTKNSRTNISNNYTGIFSNKNIIYILLESIDSFLITEDAMPTLSTLQKQGLNFTNKYTPFFGGGQTINTEFSANTGLYSPNDINIFNQNNTYKTSLANLFKENGYTASSIHFNNGFYYNRRNFHLNLGYTNHYALKDMQLNNSKYNYEYDSNLILDEEVFNLIVREEPFLTFITTYSTHLPYANNKKCLTNRYGLNADNVELTCLKNLARDTDEMIKLLIEKLEEKNILENTVLVFVTDHYAYGYSEVKKIKNESNEYLLQNTPFIIWNNQIEHQDIDILVDSADILPTILNMFAIEYNANLYIGEDAFAKDRKNYVYFNEDTFYDGTTLYDINNKNDSSEIYQEIKETIRFNDNLINTNYLSQ